MSSHIQQASFKLNPHQHEQKIKNEQKYIMKSRDNLDTVPLKSQKLSTEPIRYNYMSVFEAEIKRLQAQKQREANEQTKREEMILTNQEDKRFVERDVSSFEKGLHTIVRVRRRPSDEPLDELFLNQDTPRKRVKKKLTPEQEILQKELQGEAESPKTTLSKKFKTKFSLVTSNTGYFVKHRDLMLKQKATQHKRLSASERLAKRTKKLRLTRITKMRDSDVYDFEEENGIDDSSNIIYDYYVDSGHTHYNPHAPSTVISIEPTENVTFFDEYEDDDADEIDYEDEDRADHPNYDYGNYEAVIGDPEKEDLYNEFDYDSDDHPRYGSDVDSDSSDDPYQEYQFGYITDPEVRHQVANANVMLDDEDEQQRQEDVFFERLMQDEEDINQEDYMQ